MEEKMLERELGWGWGKGRSSGVTGSQAGEFTSDVTGSRKDLKLVSVELMKTDLVGMRVMD